LRLFDQIDTHFVDHLRAHDHRASCFNQQLGPSGFPRIVVFYEGIESDVCIN
jgi:hypothetical protein